MAGDLEDAVAIANEIAPEHLELCVDAPFDYLGKVKNAGSIFLGRYSPEPVGDYLAGTNHTLPHHGHGALFEPAERGRFREKELLFLLHARGARGRGGRHRPFRRRGGLHGHAVSATIRREG